MRLALLLSLYFANLANAFVHVRAAPFIKKSISTFDAVDPVSFSILPIIHKTLFELGRDSIPIPILVERFFVSADQLSYRLKLGSHQFHSGDILKAVDVKYTFEKFVSKRGVNWERLLIIDGAIEFSQGNTNKIKGIELDKSDDRTVILKLAKPDPTFLYKLCDFRLSILKKGGSANNGLGEYRRKETKKVGELRFEKIDKDLPGPDVVLYKSLRKKEAIRDFKNEKAHDLVLFQLNKDELNKVEAFSNISRFHFPRTYGLFINANTLESKERATLRQVIVKDDILLECYKRENRANYLIPPGFIGHLTGVDRKTDINKRECPKGKIKLVVPYGLKGEKCLLEKVRKELHSCKNITIVNNKFDKVIKDWSSNQITGYFGYVEAESSADLFSHFIPNSTFMLGVESDKFIVKFLDGYLKELDPKKKFEKALSINKHINSLNTVEPLFYENSVLVTSKRYKEFKVGIKSGISVKMSDFVLRNP